MTDDLDLQSEYREARRVAAIAYQRDNLEGYSAILKATMADFTGEAGQFKALMALTLKRCAKAGGMPDYQTWKATREVTT